MGKKMKNSSKEKADGIRIKGRDSKTKKYILTTLKFIGFQLVFGIIVAPLIIFYGPFENVKTTIVGASMTTLTHQYIAKMFLSDEEINKILNNQKVEVIEESTETEDIKVPVKRDDTIEKDEISSGKFKGYMLVIKDPTRVKVGYTQKLGREGQLTSQIAKDNDAVAAVNGGGFPDQSQNWTGTGATPTGIIMTGGDVKFDAIKNDEEKVDTMAIDNQGILLVGKYSLSELKKKNVKEALSFGPPLVVNGKGTIKSGDGGWGIAPRTAIGQRKDGAILMLVIDGRQISSVGASLREVQDLMLQYGAVNATNLDGGSSSTMFLNGDVINNPSNSLGERSVPSIVYVK